MKQLCKINHNKLSTLSGLRTSTNKNLIIRKDCYSNFLGFKTLNLTPNNEHFEDWNVAKKGIWEQNKWHYESDEEIMDDGNIINKNFVEEEQPLENDWDNNFRFKMGNKWIGFDEDSSSGQDRYTKKIGNKRRKNLEELFYSPNMEVHEFPEETDRLQYFTIEDIPQDISQEDVNSVLTKLVGEKCVSVERFEVNRKSHLFVEMKSINSKNKLMTPARMNFGLFIKGKRCDIYDSIKRQKSVFLAKLPSSCNEEDIKEYVNKIMQQSKVDVTITKPNDHTYCFLEFKKHSTASNFIERINIMANHYANWGKGMSKPKSDVYSLFDQSLVGLKDKLSSSQSKLRKYQSLLELKGYRFDEDGDLIEDASETEVEKAPKKVSRRSKTLSEDNEQTEETPKKSSRRKSNKAKVDISEEI